DFLPVNRNDAEHDIIFAQRNLDCGASATQIDERPSVGFAGAIWLLITKIDVLNYGALSALKAVGRSAWTRDRNRFVGKKFGIGCRYTAHRRRDVALSLENPHPAESGVAQSHCLFEHGIKHGSEVAG